MKKASLEFKVGIFVFFALTILTLLVFKAGDFYMKPGYTIRLIFDFVSGIDKGSPVRLAGVNVGEVSGIRIIRSAEGVTQAEVMARIDQGVAIEQDADARINTLGILGERYVEILPGTAGNKLLGDGSMLAGRTPVILEKITESGSRLISKLERTADNINDIVADPKFKESVKNTFGNTDTVMKNLASTTDDLKDAAKSARIVLGRLRDGEGSLGRLLKDEQMARDLEDFVKDIKAHPWKLLKRT